MMGDAVRQESSILLKTEHARFYVNRLLTFIVIDCCDGSDESNAKCPNVCEEASKKHKEKMATELAVTERGLALREAYVQHAQSERTRHLQLISEAEAKQVTLDAKLAELEKLKIAAEEAYSSAHEKVEERITAEMDAKYVALFLPFVLNKSSKSDFAH